jgi:hypothetical protein
VHWTAVTHPLDTREEGQTLPILRIRQDEDRPHLCNRLRQNSRGHHGRSLQLMGEIPLVERDVLDADNALVDFEFRDAIDQEKRVPVRQNAFDRGIVERKRHIHVSSRL